MGTSIYRFSDVEAKTAKPDTVKNAIKDCLRADDDACYEEMEQYLRPPGITGSRSFDQAYAVRTLLDHDHKQAYNAAMQACLQKSGKKESSREESDQVWNSVTGRIRVVMKATGMSERLLWDKLQTIFKQTGFKFKHGRLVGLLEHHEEDTNGDPDID